MYYVGTWTLQLARPNHLSTMASTAGKFWGCPGSSQALCEAVPTRLLDVMGLGMCIARDAINY